MPFVLSLFEKITCVLHHFAFLFWLDARVFSSSIAPILPLKPRFFTPVLPFLPRFFIALKGFVYAIAVDVYAFASHLAAFYPAFCTISPCI